MKSIFKISATILLCLCSCIGVFAQEEQNLLDENTTAMLKAGFIYQFSKLSDWPMSSKEGRFDIAVLGDDDVYHTLVDQYSSQSIGSQSILVSRLTEPFDLEGIEVVYVAPGREKDLQAIIDLSENKSIMIISDGAPPATKGMVFNFRIVDNKIAFEINLTEADKRRIIIGEKIKSWAFKKQ